jgi:hypothetical protein
MGLVVKSYVRKGLLIYGEMCKYLTKLYIRGPLAIYDFATGPF